MRHFRLSRDTVYATVGLLGIAYETVVHQGSERPALLFVFTAMLGLPFVQAANRFLIDRKDQS